MTAQNSAPPIRQGFCKAIGNTPLIRLNGLSDHLKCEIYGKAEFLNPGGSVKDRAALGIVEDAEKRGLLKPGGTIVEGTAGNTGIGLALVGNAKGYKTVIVIPNTQAREKFEILSALGAEVRPVDPAPYSNPNNYNHIAKKIASEMPGAFYANQFDNVANAEIHYKTTGPEIWAQTQGKITAFVASIGTGGTLAGTSRFLKEKSPKLDVIVADPFGASMYGWFKMKRLDYDDGDSFIEGIGQDRVTANAATAIVDDVYRIGDPVVFEMLNYLLKEEGLFLGATSAINVCGAVKRAIEKGPGQTIVTVLCDGGGRYVSKSFNQEWLAKNELTPKDTGLEIVGLIQKSSFQ